MVETPCAKWRIKIVGICSMNPLKLVMILVVLMAVVCCVAVPSLPGYDGPFTHSNSAYYGTAGYFGLHDY
jgi:hypothetical protein